MSSPIALEELTLYAGTVGTTGAVVPVGNIGNWLRQRNYSRATCSSRFCSEHVYLRILGERQGHPLLWGKGASCLPRPCFVPFPQDIARYNIITYNVLCADTIVPLLPNFSKMMPMGKDTRDGKELLVQIKNRAQGFTFLQQPMGLH